VEERGRKKTCKIVLYGKNDSEDKEGVCVVYRIDTTRGT